SCYLRAWVAEGNSQRVRSSDTSAGETDLRCSRATGERRISPNDPKIIVREHREKSKTLIKNFCVFQRAIFNWKFFKKKILNILYEERMIMREKISSIVQELEQREGRQPLLPTE